MVHQVALAPISEAPMACGHHLRRLRRYRIGVIWDETVTTVVWRITPTVDSRALSNQW